jgi:hypothetical protein
MKTRNGFASFEILAVLAVVTLVGFLGYTAYMRYQGQVATKKSTDVVATAPAKIDDISRGQAEILRLAAIDEARKVKAEAGEQMLQGQLADLRNLNPGQTIRRPY